MIIKSVISVIIALLLGNGAVVWFNNMPVRWFQEEGENLPPSLIADIEGEKQRLPSTPWKLVFTVFFGASGVFLSIRESSQFMIAGMLLIFIITMMAICDAKYSNRWRRSQVLHIDWAGDGSSRRDCYFYFDFYIRTYTHSISEHSE